MFSNRSRPWRFCLRIAAKHGAPVLMSCSSSLQSCGLVAIASGAFNGLSNLETLFARSHRFLISTNPSHQHFLQSSSSKPTRVVSSRHFRPSDQPLHAVCLAKGIMTYCILNLLHHFSLLDNNLFSTPLPPSLFPNAGLPHLQTLFLSIIVNLFGCLCCIAGACPPTRIMHWTRRRF